MTRSLTRAARWHRTDKGVMTPYSSRRLSAEEFKAHDLVMNSEAVRDFWIQAFEVREDEGQIVGVVWSQHNNNSMPHQRQSNRFIWVFVNWRFEVRRYYKAHRHLSVRYWYSRGAAVEALFHIEERRRALQRLERKEEARKNTEAAALDDFYVQEFD